LYNVEIQGFKGKADKVFYGMCDQHTWSDGLVITQETFGKRIRSMGVPIMLVIRQAMAANHKKIQQRLAKSRRSNLKKEDIAQLIFFRNFIEPLFESPEKVFDDIAGDDGCVDEDEFVTWLAGHKYPGDAKKVFQCFCDHDGIIARFAFSELIATCKKIVVDEEGDEVEDEDEKKQDVEESKSEGAPPSKNRGLGRARTLSLDGASAQEALAAKASEVAKAAKAGQLRRVGTQSLKPESDDSKTANASTDASKAAKGRRRSNSITSMDGDGDEAQRASQAAKVNRRRSNSITSMDGEQDDGPKMAKGSRRRSNSITSMDGDQEDPQDSGKPAQHSRRRSNSITSMDGDHNDIQDSDKKSTPERRPSGGQQGFKGKAGRVRSKSLTVETSPKLFEQLKAQDPENEDAPESGESKRKASAKSRASRTAALKRAQSRGGGGGPSVDDAQPEATEGDTPVRPTPKRNSQRRKSI